MSMQTILTNPLTGQDFLRYVEFKRGQHARCIASARVALNKGKPQRVILEYLDRAAAIRRVICEDIMLVGGGL